MAKLASRFRGSLIGALIGDCFGAQFEFLPMAITASKVVDFVTVLEKKKPEKRKESLYFTDDTEMREGVEESLLEKKGFDKKDMATRFAERYFVSPPKRSYGSHVPNVFMAWKRSDYENIDTPAMSQFNFTGSYGNGGGMRIAPAALFTHHQSPEKLKELSDKITKLTHTHILGIHGAYLQALSVWLALKAEESQFSTKEFVDQLKEKMKFYEDEYSNREENKDKNLDSEESHCYLHKLDIIKSFLDRKDVSNEEVVKELGHGVSSQSSIPTAVYAFLRSVEDTKTIPNRNGFERTIIYAISLDGDTDTIATMAGAIAGAFWGEESIPKSWQECCQGLDTAEKTAKSLYQYVTEQS
ncbi:ADP-ribose glycohydrolase ARH3 [Octopus sinensis]|uniref:ADP-ribosylhydrolase ARH3 n=1 Tax=Octopus sinensis TaxID=2607531 RepID=A0A6P7T3Y2_9MOLL|nr:ADP-ribose glycohydrolase ARH3 [Octopus sinensis]